MSGTLLIRNCRAVNANGTQACSILVEDGKVAALLGPRATAAADRVIDAGERYVIPGGIDPHVHMEVGAQNFEEDCRTESRAAVTGGITTFIHFLIESDSYLSWYERYKKGVEQNSLVDFSFHAAIMSEEQLQDMPKYVEDLRISSFKFFMAYKGPTAVGKLRGVEDGQLLDGFRTLARYPWTTGLVHCENIEVVNREVEKIQARGGHTLADWTASRPPVCETEAIARAAALAEDAGSRLYIVHMSVGEGTYLVEQLKRRYPKVMGETCGTYLALDNTLKIREDPEENASLLKVNPPLRTRRDVELMWDGIQRGVISTVGSDHCAYTTAFTGKNLWTAAPGLPGTTMIIPVLLTEGVHKGRITLEQLVQLTSYNAANIFGCGPRKGVIAVGSDADLVILDVERKVTVTPDKLHSVADYSPYEGYVAHGWPAITIARGNVVYEDGKVVDSAPRGRVLLHNRYLA